MTEIHDIEHNIDTDLKPFETLIKLCIYSYYLEKDKPVTTIAFAEQELAKTRSLMKYSHCQNISVQTDLTYYGIVESLLPKIQIGLIHTIIIPDLLKPITKKSSTSANFITIINALIEEGVFDVTIHTSKNFGGCVANILSSMTPGVLLDKRRGWTKYGFFSRIIPFSFSYGNDMTKTVMQNIKNYQIPKEDFIILNLPLRKRDISISEKYTYQAQQWAIELGLNEGYTYITKGGAGIDIKGSKGFRHLWQFMALLKSCALMRDANEVNAEDVQTIQDIYPFINYQYNKIDDYVLKTKS
jgi:hypothetical protein